VSRTLFRMSLVMVVCTMLCSVRLAGYGCASYAVQRETQAAQHFKTIEV